MFGESIYVFDSKSVIYSAWFSTLCSGSNFTNFWNKSCISSWQVLNSVAFGCNFKRIWYFAQNYLYLKLYNSLHPDNKAEFFLNLFIFFLGWLVSAIFSTLTQTQRNIWTFNSVCDGHVLFQNTPAYTKSCMRNFSENIEHYNEKKYPHCFPPL